MKAKLRVLFALCAIWFGLWVSPVQAEEPPGVPHKVVYQCNKGELSDYKSLLYSVSQMKEKYGDGIDIIMVCHGPGIHLLSKKPRRMVHAEALDQMGYLDTFGVQFHACGNTMNALGWHEEDMHDFVEVVQIGAEDLMLLQEQGYTYLSW